VDEREATAFAAGWERDWNAHDLDALLAQPGRSSQHRSPPAAGEMIGASP